MTAPRRRYSRTDKAKAVGLAVAEGQSVAAEQTGIPLSTIHTWITRPEFVALRNEKREVVAESFWAGVQVGLKAVVDEFAGDADIGKKAIALGVLYDKFALLSGQATSRSETRNLTDALDDHEKELLRDVIDKAAEEANAVGD